MPQAGSYDNVSSAAAADEFLVWVSNVLKNIPLSVLAAYLYESGGPTLLTMGAVADGEYLTRSGSTIVGAAGGGSSVNLLKIWTVG